MKWGCAMPFVEAVKRLVLVRACYRCECRRPGHDHEGRCKAWLHDANVEFRHKLAVKNGGGDTYANCEVICHSCYLYMRRRGQPG
jgi:hypothetical protein